MDNGDFHFAKFCLEFLNMIPYIIPKSNTILNIIKIKGAPLLIRIIDTRKEFIKEYFKIFLIDKGNIEDLPIHLDE